MPGARFCFTAPLVRRKVHKQDSEDSPECEARQIKRETAQFELDGFEV